MADTDDLAEAINNLAEAIRETGCRIAEDAPLNMAVGAGLQDIAEAINRFPASSIGGRWAKLQLLLMRNNDTKRSRVA